MRARWWERDGEQVDVRRAEAPGDWARARRWVQDGDDEHHVQRTLRATHVAALVRKQIDECAAALGSSAAPVRVDELSEKQSSHDFATPQQKIGALSRLSVVGRMQRECGSATVTVDGGWTAQ
jgi:hypothetical protein